MPQQSFEAAVEPLADGGEAPAVLAVEVTEHDGTFGGELGLVERVTRDFLAAGHDAQIAGGDAGHRALAVDGRREGEPVDRGRHPVEGDAERVRVTRLGTELLESLLGRLRLVVEDEVTVVREPFVRVEAETADVEDHSGPGDLHAHVQVGAQSEVAEPGLPAALEVGHHT